MRRVIRRLVVWVVVTAGLVALASVIESCQRAPQGEGKAYNVDRAHVDVAVQRDGSLVVVEHLDFAYRGNFSGAYRDIHLESGVELSALSVSDRRFGGYRAGGSTILGSIDTPGTFGAAMVDPHTVRVVWHYQQQSGQRRFTLRYRIRNQAVAYRDALVVPWAPWGDQWSFWLNHLTATIRLAQPRGNSRPIDAWLRSKVPASTLRTTSTGVQLTLERAKPRSLVGLTVAFPRTATATVTGARRTNRAGLASTRARAERQPGHGRIAEAADAVWRHQRLLLALITLGIALSAALLAWRAREHRQDAPKYVPQPPGPQPPAVAYGLAHEGAYDERVVLATLLDLVDRGFYAAEPTEDTSLDLCLRIAEPRPAAREPYEQAVLDFFDDLLERGPCALGKLAERIPSHSAAWNARWTAMNAALRRAAEAQVHWDRDLRRSWCAAVLLAVLLYVVVLVGVVLRSGLFALPAAGLLSGALLAAFVPRDWMRRRDPASMRVGAQWAAFARWTDDFPKLDDDPPATLALWRRVLVYAVAFGTAERVVTSGRIPAPLAEQDGGWSSAMTHGATYSALSGQSFSSGFSTRVAPQSSSSSSGGGSSGGGGFSGGGGGGAW